MTRTRPLWLRPAIVLAIVVVVARFVLPIVLPIVAPDAVLVGTALPVIAFIAGLVCSALIGLWWLLLSRAAWSERVGALVLMVAALFVSRLFVDESIRGGFMGRMLYIYTPPVFAVALVVWAVATRHLSDGARRAALVATIVLAAVPFTLIRTGGVMGVSSDLHFRWTPTPEDRLLAQATNEPVAVAPLPAPAPAPTPEAAAVAPAMPALSERGVASRGDVARVEGSERGVASRGDVARVEGRVEWPGFRGPNRDSVIRGVRINTDWSASPPVEIWRKPIGPGWSSFAVRGDVMYTQEQRGNDEIVAAYTVSTGEPVWKHRDPARFYESNGGAGPRGTPTISGTRVYAMGATGIVNALDARTGAVIWSHNAASDTGKEVPGWGIASSPVVFDDLVILGVAGQLIAYDAATGTQRWIGQSGGAGYSSPQLLTIDGVPQVLLSRGARTISVAPKDGTLLWDHTGGPPASSIVQPALTPDGDVLVAPSDAMSGLGIRRVAVTHGPDGWKAEERWHSRGLKPYFNDFVVHKGHAYGFDGAILSSINLADGERTWKGGRYGNGQMLLLADQDLLLITSDDGEIALVSATPDKFTELARIPALNAKTWNHPVIVRDILLVRNGEEMVAFKLQIAAPLTDSR